MKQDEPYDPDRLQRNERVQIVLSGECRACENFVPDSPTGTVLWHADDIDRILDGTQDTSELERDRSHPYMVILDRPLLYQATNRDGAPVILDTWLWGFARSELRRVEAPKTDEGTDVPLPPQNAT